MRKGEKVRWSRLEVTAANRVRNNEDLGMAHRRSRCRLEGWLPHWTRAREKRRQSEMVPWLLTRVTRWSVEALSTKTEGQVLGSEDRFHWA